jgi:hypothetical protein
MILANSKNLLELNVNVVISAISRFNFTQFVVLSDKSEPEIKLKE